MSVLKPICFHVAVCFATILSRCEPGYCHQQLSVDLGPRNITRYEHEANVYIPCPFSGSSNPIWRINGIDYEAFNLPFNMLPVSYGLLIPSVELGMDGKSFQCILPVGQSQELSSSIGTLKVEKVSQEYMPWYREDNAAIQTSFSSTTFSLNHQKTFFEAEFKTFSWNMDNSCNNYRVTSMNCDGDEHSLWDWNIIQGTSLVIPSSYIVDSSSGQPLYFTLESLIIEGRTVTVCDSLPSNFAVKKSDITERKSASYSGICIDVDSETGGLTVVLPRKTIGNDCPCTISLNNTQTSSNLTTCSCIGDTIFMDSLRVSRSEQPTNTMSYSICFYNLTREMNNTIIHFYDNNRSCTDSNGVPRIRPFRMYLKSMRIMIELPYQPIITVNVKTGEVFFSSDAAEGIELDHYKLTLSDVTNFVVYHRTIPHDMNSTSFGDIFQHSVCSPYNLTVSAYSVLGNSISTITMIGTGNNECTCIAENVAVELDLIINDESHQPEIGVQLQVNCTKNYYEDSVSLQIEIQQDGINVTTPITAICKKAVTYHPVKFLECDKGYDLIPYWTSDTNKRCDLNSENFNKKVPCSEKSGTTYNVPIIASVGSVSGASLFICGIVILILCIKLRNAKKKRHEYAT